MKNIALAQDRPSLAQHVAVYTHQESSNRFDIQAAACAHESIKQKTRHVCARAFHFISTEYQKLKTLAAVQERDK
jgi:hypothetical protein